jgi:protein-disulfide isomerase
MTVFTSQDSVATTQRIVATTDFSRFAAIALTLIGATAFGQIDPSRLLADVPGFDFTRLPPNARRELATVLTDEFDYCGRPLTLLASLKKGDACRHTRRLVGYAASMAAEGTAAQEIIVSLSKYNQTFSKGRVALKPDERQCMGPRDAKVTLVEFSDFECPFCAAARPILEEYVKARPNLRLCWMPYPLPQHPNATVASQAALFARDAGKFWAMHDALFDNQLSLSEDFIKQLVLKHGLDGKAFEKVIATKKYVDELEASKDWGKKGGVDSTPTIFFNGRKYSLGLNAESLSLAVDDELDWQTGNNTWPSN